MSVKICSKCFKIHPLEWATRKRCIACRCKLFKCDEYIAPIIRDLNLKGYFTSFCCSGHPYMLMNGETYRDLHGGVDPERLWQCYIMFAPGIHIECLPEHFSLDRGGVGENQEAVYLHASVDCDVSIEEMIRLTFFAWSSLAKWARELPEYLPISSA